MAGIPEDTALQRAIALLRHRQTEEQQEQHKGQQTDENVVENNNKEQDYAVVDEGLRQALLTIGVTPSVADGLLLNYSRDEIERQIDALPKRNIRTNAAGMLVSSIKGGWSIPSAQLPKRRVVAAPEWQSERKRRTG